MRKMNFEQMEVINGGQTMVNATSVDIENEAIFKERAIFNIRPCVVGKWVTGSGLILIGAGVPFTCGTAALAFGLIAGATTIFC